MRGKCWVKEGIENQIRFDYPSLHFGVFSSCSLMNVVSQFKLPTPKPEEKKEDAPKK